MSQSARVRAGAAKVLAAVIGEGRSLSDVLPGAQAALGPDADRRLLGALVYGSLRWYGRLDPLLGRLLNKPLGPRQLDLHCLMVCGLFELHYLSTPRHAAVAETVNAARQLGQPRAAGLVNAILRRDLREGESILQELDRDVALRHAHPQWMVVQLQRDWPLQWAQVLEQNNRQAPFWLRVNLHRVSREAYRERLASEAGLAAGAPDFLPSALLLDHPVDVERLPGFDQGLVSVQDGAAQLAGHWLEVAAGQRVLDACAAPGNKTAHLLELGGGDLDLLALDRSAERLERLQANLRRMGYQAAVRQADAACPESWWDGRAFDRILLDAPCSATGVIRRHPDIKWLRRPGDLVDLQAAQAAMLSALWPLLAPGGQLLYSTCSVFRGENDRQVQQFLASTADARVSPPPALPGAGSALAPGFQLLPGDAAMDGFYYVRLRKEFPRSPAT